MDFCQVLAGAEQRFKDSSKVKAAAAPPLPCLPGDVAGSLLAAGGDPYEKIKRLFLLATERMKALQELTSGAGAADAGSLPGARGSFFFASDDTLLSALGGGPPPPNAVPGPRPASVAVAGLAGFEALPPEIRSVMETGSYNAVLSRKLDGRRFVAHSEEVLPGHSYDFAVQVAEGKVRLGWRWSALADGPLVFRPAWLHELLSVPGDNPQAKLNARVERINAWVEKLHGRQAELLRGFGSGLRRLEPVVRELLAGGAAAGAGARALLAPHAGQTLTVHEAWLDGEHCYRLVAEVWLDASGDDAPGVDVRWVWA